MESPRLIPLVDQDIKKLKRKRLFQFVFFIYMSIVSFGMVGFSIWLYFDDEDVIGMMTGAGTLCGLYVVAIVCRSWSNLKKDLSNGTKAAMQGEITKKYSHKNRHELTINDEDYVVNYKNYALFSKGQHVLIAYSPLSKVILDIYKLPSTDKD